MIRPICELSATKFSHLGKLGKKNYNIMDREKYFQKTFKLKMKCCPKNLISLLLFFKGLVKFGQFLIAFWNYFDAFGP